MNLVLPIQFTDTDGSSDLPNGVIAVNAWPGKLIESVEIFKNNTNINITPQQQLKPYKLMINKLKKIPKNKLRLFKDLQYSSKEVTVDNRRSNTSTVTEVNLKDRINKYHDKQKSENYYRIPLKFLTKYGQIDEIIFQNVKIVFNLENDMRKIFERNGTLAADPHKAAASYKFHKCPT